MIVPLDQRYLSLHPALQVVIALAVLAVVGLWAYWKRQLTVSGLITAVLRGLATTLSGGFSALSL